MERALDEAEWLPAPERSAALERFRSVTTERHLVDLWIASGPAPLDDPRARAVRAAIHVRAGLGLASPGPWHEF